MATLRKGYEICVFSSTEVRLRGSYNKELNNNKYILTHVCVDTL